jgi:hypothetical protein
MPIKYFAFVWWSFLLLLLSACHENIIQTTSSYSPLEKHQVKIPHQVASRSVSSQGILHAILVANTDDKAIGSEIDLKKITELLEMIEINTGLTLEIHTMAGNHFNYNQVTNTLTHLSVNPNDVVMFYYSGHGINKDEQSRWPSMQVGNRLLNLTWVTSTLKEKNPRFFIAISDSCNNFIKSIPTTNTKGITQGENFKPLFLDYQGYIISSAAKPGQMSGGSSQHGGLFTKALLKSLNEEMASTNPNWHTIMARAETPISFTDQFGNKQLQMPQSKINITRVDNKISPVTFPKNELSVQVIPSQPFKIGDTMQIRVINRSHQNGYLFIWDINSAGKLTRILPNDIAHQHRMTAGQTITIPEHTYSGFSLTMAGPLGKGIVVAILVENSLKQQLLSERFESISATQAHSALQQMRSQLNQTLGTLDNSITTVEYEITH